MANCEISEKLYDLQIDIATLQMALDEEGSTYYGSFGMPTSDREKIYSIFQAIEAQQSVMSMLQKMFDGKRC